MRGHGKFIAIFVGITCWGVGSSWAAQACVLSAKRSLVQVEAQVQRLAAGDVRNGNNLIRTINSAKSSLSKCSKRGTPDWNVQAAKASKLDALVRTKLAGGAASAPAQADAATKAAASLVGEVEGKLKTLASGDVKAGNELIRAVNQAVQKLNQSKVRGSALWAETGNRAKALDAAVRARIKGAPAPAKAAVAAGTTSQPAVKVARLGTDDSYKFRRDFKKVFPGYERDLARTPLSKIAKAYTFNKFNGAISRMRKALKKLRAQSHPDVQAGYAQLDTLAAALAARHEEGKLAVAKSQAEAADAAAAAKQARAEAAAAQAKSKAEALAKAKAEAKAFEKELVPLEGIFDPKDLGLRTSAPYTTKRMRDWMAHLKETETKRVATLAKVEALKKAYPPYAKHSRVRKLEGVLTHKIPRDTKNAIARLNSWYDVSGGKAQGAWLHRIKQGKRYLDPAFTTSERLGRESWVKSALETLAEGIEASRAFGLFEAEYLGKPNPAHEAVAKQLEAEVARIEKVAEGKLAERRMPEAASTDSSLIAIVKRELADPKHGTGKYHRIVINASKTSHEETQSESRDEGDYRRIWTWTEVWDQFQACLAEEVKGETRLVYYTMKYMHRGPKWKPLGRWYVRNRIVSRRILPENIQK